MTWDKVAGNQAWALSLSNLAAILMTKASRCIENLWKHDFCGWFCIHLAAS